MSRTVYLLAQTKAPETQDACARSCVEVARKLCRNACQCPWHAPWPFGANRAAIPGISRARRLKTQWAYLTGPRTGYSISSSRPRQKLALLGGRQRVFDRTTARFRSTPAHSARPAAMRAHHATVSLRVPSNPCDPSALALCSATPLGAILQQITFQKLLFSSFEFERSDHQVAKRTTWSLAERRKLPAQRCATPRILVYLSYGSKKGGSKQMSFY